MPVVPDIKGADSVLRALRNRMGQIGLADFLDADLPVGKITQQIILLRRLMTQYKLTDVLDSGLNSAAVNEAMDQLRKQAVTIPVSFDAAPFDVSEMMPRGPAVSLAEHIKTQWDVPPLKPVADAAAKGVTEDIPVHFDASSFDVSEMLPQRSGAGPV